MELAVDEARLEQRVDADAAVLVPHQGLAHVLGGYGGALDDRLGTAPQRVLEHEIGHVRSQHAVDEAAREGHDCVLRRAVLVSCFGGRRLCRVLPRQSAC